MLMASSTAASTAPSISIQSSGTPKAAYKEQKVTQILYQHFQSRHMKVKIEFHFSHKDVDV